MKSFRLSVFAISLAVASASAAVLVPSSGALAAPVPVANAVPANSVSLAQSATAALGALSEFLVADDVLVAQRYVVARDALAASVAIELNIEPTRMQAAWANADLNHQRALLAALTQLGVPYRRNTSAEGQAFDCSGLTSYAWGVAGVKLAHQSRTQIRAAQSIAAANAQAGDLVYYPGHVSMYLGVDRAIVHAVGTGRHVELGHSRASKNIRFGNPAA